MDAGADDAAHEAAFQHAAGTVLVAIHRDRRALLECRRIRSPQTGDELRREIDVHDAGDPEAAEKSAPSLRSPDEARADHRAGFDLLVRPHLHLRSHARVIADDRVVADHAAFLEDDARLQCALPAHDRAVELRPFADVRVAPHDGTVDDGADVDGDVVAQHGRSDDLGVRTDLHALAEKDGPR